MNISSIDESDNGIVECTVYLSTLEDNNCLNIDKISTSTNLFVITNVEDVYKIINNNSCTKYNINLNYEETLGVVDSCRSNMKYNCQPIILKSPEDVIAHVGSEIFLKTSFIEMFEPKVKWMKCVCIIILIDKN